ncbi:MAG TPA: hypothetical protein VN429_01545 [Methanospirillum sp.]|uniref:hypothetical protein n=1 Tax=Methanospirillum sp. TaxID=45200 RepID=UPI002BAC7307|nr:hypothetical protein [Methanospirillum sp.]HWQ63071.1 hypothetical protein [Methanospirillum sp.]
MALAKEVNEKVHDIVNPCREKAICSKPRYDGKLTHLNGDLHDLGTISLLYPFIENGEASLNDIPDS